jgi:hypothetical protein
MSDEEKEAIEILKLYFGDNPTLNITKYVNIVLNLIEKQSQEIEELKDKNKNLENELIVYKIYTKQDDLKDFDLFLKQNYVSKKESKQKEKQAYNFGYRNGCNDTSKFNDKTFIRVDKIKAKIEEINKEMLNEENSLELFYRKKYCKEVLQSLLEKE